MRKYASRPKRLFWLTPVFGSLLGLAGCFPNQFGSDLLASTVSAITGDIVFTALDYVLPRPPE